DAGLQDVVGGSRADFAGKHALKVASAHGHALGEDIDGEFAIEVLSDPDLQFANRGHVGGLSGKRDADLRLATGTAEKQHELTSGFMGDAGAAVLLDPGESE